MLAVEYDGDHHRLDPIQFAYDIQRSEDLDELGWTTVSVVARQPSRRCLAPRRASVDAHVDSALTALATRTFAP